MTINTDTKLVNFAHGAIVEFEKRIGIKLELNLVIDIIKACDTVDNFYTDEVNGGGYMEPTDGLDTYPRGAVIDDISTVLFGMRSPMNGDPEMVKNAFYTIAAKYAANSEKERIGE